MRVLLDTHAFLWWTQDDAKLSTKARGAIANSERYLSMASCWEIAIKAGLGRLQFDRPVAKFLIDQLSANGISLLPIEFHHVMRVASLPLHHRDPFDRLLAAQASEARLSIVSAETIFDQYGVARIW